MGWVEYLIPLLMASLCVAQVHNQTWFSFEYATIDEYEEGIRQEGWLSFWRETETFIFGVSSITLRVLKTSVLKVLKTNREE